MKSKPDELFADSFKTGHGTGWIVYSGAGLLEVKLPKKGSKQPLGTRLRKTDLSRQLEAYFAGKKIVFDAKIDWSLYSEFEKDTLKECRRVTYGKTVSYKNLALKIDNKNAFRAVGNTLNKNKTPVVIPCHRVLRSDGTIGGFASGRAAKKRLLELENI